MTDQQQQQPNNDPQLLFTPPGSIEALVGRHLIKKKAGLSDKDRESVYLPEDCTTDEFKNTHKYLAIFFGASYCPPCQTFLRILKEFYAEVNIDSKQCEILYVSLDKTEQDFIEDYAQMPWLAVPFHD